MFGHEDEEKKPCYASIDALWDMAVCLHACCRDCDMLPCPICRTAIPQLDVGYPRDLSGAN